MTGAEKGTRTWRADRMDVARARSALVGLLAYLVLVTVLMPFHPPDPRSAPSSGPWLGDVPVLAAAVLGWVVYLVVAVRALRAVSAVTLYADGSILLAAPLRSLHIDADRVRGLRRVRLVSDELITADTTVRLAGGMLCAELIEALVAARPGLAVEGGVAVRHPTRPRPASEPAPAPEPRPTRSAGSADWAAPVRGTIARRSSTTSVDGWSAPVRRASPRRRGGRSGHWVVPFWWFPVGVVLLGVIGIGAAALPAVLILAVPMDGILFTVDLALLAGLWWIYSLIAVLWAFLVTSLDLDADGTLTVVAPARTLRLRVADVWEVRLRINRDDHGNRRRPMVELEGATGRVFLPNSLVDHDLLDTLSNANPLMRVPRRGP